MFTINLKLRYKLEKKYIISNAFLHLCRNNNFIDNLRKLDRIDTLYLQIYALITMHTTIIEVLTTYFVTLIEEDFSIILF